MSEFTIGEEPMELNKEYVIKIQNIAKSWHGIPTVQNQRKAASQYSYARWTYQNWIHTR